MCMVLLPPSSDKTNRKAAGPVTLLMGGLVFVVVMWGILLADLIRRLLR